MAILFSNFVLFAHIYIVFLVCLCYIIHLHVMSGLGGGGGNKNNCFTKGPDIKCLVILLKGFHFNGHKEYKVI